MDIVNNFADTLNTRKVSYDTAYRCLKFVELYLNQNDTECLVVENNEPGGWNLVIKNWRDFNDECE